MAAASDIYSLGLVLLEALTGHREYEGTEEQVAVARLLRDPAIPENLPLEWRQLLAAMTTRDASGRPAADEVARRLRGILSPTGSGRAGRDALGRRARRGLRSLFTRPALVSC
ncbi:protein kinase family protein [Herbiconiux sp. SYSU D00978]|uniref:hypothetical protein n=1 Tax=Herbiconiux sp. SYSU D00978 TaxID=2812562 RepID=UPI001A970373|nr:hypothetical protein [Herbiconiux sp. SYSU D00978]